MSKILVIEDEKPVLTNIVEILESGGFDAIGARSGAIGMRLAKEHSPQLILCDIMMPELDGYGVFETLSQDPLTAGIPFIFLTAKADSTDVRRGMNLGVDDYLTKPFRRAELLEAVAVRLNKQRTVVQHYSSERQRAEDLQKRVEDLQHLTSTQARLLKKLTEDLRQPLSNINMAIHMLKNTPAEAQRNHYLSILQEEFSNEIALINQVSELQNLLTPENIRLLQHFDLLKQKTDFGRKPPSS